jgi:hypothetical protein
MIEPRLSTGVTAHRSFRISGDAGWVHAIVVSFGV